MTVTIILSVIMMAGLFLLLLAGVGFIQDNRFFTSAPKEIQAVILPKEERFPGQHILGWFLAVISIVLMVGPLVYAGWDGIRNGFTYRQFFCRYVMMLLLLKAFDIFFFDWILLCNSNFFPHFYPEGKDLLGRHLFGFNKKDHAVQIVLCLVIAAVLSAVCVRL